MQFIAWHFWVRKHFTVGLWLKEEENIRGNATERCNMRRGLARLPQVINVCARTSISAFLSIFLSHIAAAPVSSLYYESLSGTWASPVSIQLLDWPQMSTWKWCQTMSAREAYFSSLLLCSLKLSCSAGRKQAQGQTQQTSLPEKNNQRKWRRWCRSCYITEPH